MGYRYIIGIDEAGRGPLAGPIAVGAFMAPPRFFSSIGRVKDSKALSASERDYWLFKILALQGEGRCSYAVTYTNAPTIDSLGLTLAVRAALAGSLSKLRCSPRECLVLLDGGLRAPREFFRQTTIIGGDASETPIALASIAAKAHRDRHMERLAKRYPLYGFEKHKGYGTEKHYAALRRYGASPVHRATFL